jgi:hypothetical protein
MDRTQISDSSATIVPAGTAATAGAKAEEGTGIDTNISLPRMGGVDGPDSTLPVKRLLSSPSETTDDNTPSVDYATKEDPAAYNNHSPATPRRTYEHHSLPSRINKQGKRRSISLWSTFARKKDKDSQREAATNLFPNPDGDKKEKNTGKSKENTIKCLTCGHRVPQGAKFCTECGTTMMYRMFFFLYGLLNCFQYLNVYLATKLLFPRGHIVPFVALFLYQVSFDSSCILLPPPLCTSTSYL